MADEKLGGQRYQIEGELGRGASATVYRARDTVLQRTVALKVLTGALANDAALAERFAREAQWAARLEHPNIVTIYDAGTLPDGRAYISMRLLEGTALDRMIAQRAPFPLAEVVAILRQLADAVDYIHTNGLIHRDIKPSNVIVGADGQVVLTDFGIAQALEATRLTQPGLVVGTVRYMAPEQIRDDEASPAIDIYALGVIAFEMLAGRPPFEGSGTAVMYAIVHESAPDLAKLNPSLPEGVVAAVGRALAKDPAERWESAERFATALDRAAAGASSLADASVAAFMAAAGDVAGSPPAGEPPEAAPTPATARLDTGSPLDSAVVGRREPALADSGGDTVADGLTPAATEPLSPPPTVAAEAMPAATAAVAPGVAETLAAPGLPDIAAGPPVPRAPVLISAGWLKQLVRPLVWVPAIAVVLLVAAVLGWFVVRPRLLRQAEVAAANEAAASIFNGVVAADCRTVTGLPGGRSCLQPARRQSLDRGIALYLVQPAIGPQLVAALGRDATRAWHLWLATLATPYQLFDLPGGLRVCGGGQGADLYADPSAQARVVARFRDQTILQAEEFRLTRPATDLDRPGEGWYRVSRPERGWVSARLVSDARLGSCDLHDRAEEGG